MWERSPSTSVTNEIKDGIENFAHILRARMPTWLGWGNQRLEDAPLGIRQITGIGFAIHKETFGLGSLLSGERNRGMTCTLTLYHFTHTLWAGYGKQVYREQVQGFNELVLEFALPATLLVGIVPTSRSSLLAAVRFVMA